MMRLPACISTGISQFQVVQHARDPDYHRPYIDIRYIRKDGTSWEGRRWGVATPGENVTRDAPNFGEGRKVAFRVCLQVSYWPDPCSSWEVGYA